MDFKTKKKYFKERQVLYDLMKTLKEYGDVVDINGKTYKKVQPESADYVFIWFDRKPMILYYNAEHKGYIIGDRQYHISNPHKKSNRVIEFVKLVHRA